MLLLLCYSYIQGAQNVSSYIYQERNEQQIKLFLQKSPLKNQLIYSREFYSDQSTSKTPLYMVVKLLHCISFEVRYILKFYPQDEFSKTVKISFYSFFLN